MDGIAIPSHRMERNRSDYSRRNSRDARHGAPNIDRYGAAITQRLPYRITVIVASGIVAITGVTLSIIAKALS